jgi:hypothetical protein
MTTREHQSTQHKGRQESYWEYKSSVAISREMSGKRYKEEGIY